MPIARLIPVDMPRIVQIIISGKPMALCEDGSLWRGDVSMTDDGVLKMRWIEYQQSGHRYG